MARYQTVGVSDERVNRARAAAAQAAYRGADYATAESRYLALISDIRARGQDSETTLAAELDHLAQVYIRQRQYEKAEDLLTEALSIWQQQPDADSDVAVCLGMLATTYFQRNRLREAEQCNRRALALCRESQGEDSLQYAQCADHLAMTLAIRGREENKRELAHEAVSLGMQALKIFIEQLPPNHPSVHGSRQNLAAYRHEATSIGYLYSGGSPEDDSDDDSDDSSFGVANVAAALLQEPDHPHSITQLIHSAQEASIARDFSASDSLLARALTLAESKYEAMSSIVIRVHEAEIEILRRRCSMLLGEPSGILSPIQHLEMQMRAHMRRGLAEDENTPPPNAESQVLEIVCKLLKRAVRTSRHLIGLALDRGCIRTAAIQSWVEGYYVSDLMEVLHYSRLLGVLSNEESFEIAIAVMQLRSANSLALAYEEGQHLEDDEGHIRAMREQLRVREARYDSMVAQLVERALGRSVEAPSSSTESLRAEIEELRASLRAQGVSAQSTEFGSILGSSEIRSRLRDAGSALVFYLIGQRAVFVAAISERQQTLVRVEYEAGLVEAMCDQFRESIVPADGTLSPPEFNAGFGVMLYDLLVRPIRRHLEGIRHLFLVPDRALWTIPFSALVGDLEVQVSADDDPDEAYESTSNSELRAGMMRRQAALAISEDGAAPEEVTRANAWLGNHYSISLVPSIAALSRTRREARFSAQGRKSFLGIGNPAIRSSDLAPLPQTESLLEHLAYDLGANLETDVIVREQASVDRVLELDGLGELANRRVLCFATHALFPTQEGDPLAEPGLILASDSGQPYEVLSASRIRELRIDAELVMLTACFTSAPAGKTIGTPLSGLAQSFFEAGARCLLVSNWPIDANATEQLLREVFSDSNPTEPLADAVRRAAASLRSDVTDKRYQHPFFWASFSTVGDGIAAIGADV